MQVEPVGRGPRDLAAHLGEPLLRRGRELDPAALHPAGRVVAGLQAPVELDRVHVHPRERRVGTQLADEPRRVERGPARQLSPLDHDHVGLAALGEVVGDADATHASADDDDTCPGGNHLLRLGKPEVWV